MSQFSRLAVALSHARRELGLDARAGGKVHPPIAVDLPFCQGYDHLIPIPEGWAAAVGT